LPATQQRFDGPTLEAALEAAVRTLGPDLEVIDARRVRTGGIAGFFSRERYQVIAGPRNGTAGAPSATAGCGAQTLPTPGVDEVALQASIDDAIRALIEDVERRTEQAPPPRFADVLAGVSADPAAPAPASEVGAGEDVCEAEVVPDPATLVVRPADASPPAPVVAGRAAGAGSPTAPLGLAEAGEADPVGPGPDGRDESVAVGSDLATGWSRRALAELGVPSRVIAALPDRRLTTDALWIAALTEAIAAALPAPAEPGPDAEVCVSGHGPEAAVKILQAAMQGYVPGTLCLDGEVLPATPVVLALAVRACLRR
jgi:hypothetical protein